MKYKRIRDLREDNDKTQKEIAENVLQVSQRLYSNLEAGERRITAETLIKLADYYNVSIDYILNRTNKK